MQVTTDYLLGLVHNKKDHLTIAELTADERRFLEALRNGELRTLLKLLNDVIPDGPPDGDITTIDVPSDSDPLSAA